MKFLILIITAVALAVTIEDSDWVAGTIKRVTRSVNEYENNRANCSFAPNSAKFCTTRPGCSNAATFQCFNGYALNPIPCRESTPYCNSGSCVSVPPYGCEQDFICPGVGFYPKFDDCYTYYSCYFDQASNSIRFTTRQCPANYPFNPSGPEDRLCLRNSTCVKTSCAVGTLAEWKPLNYVDFTKDRIALYCSNGVPRHLDSCVAGLSIDIKNVTSRDCNMICLADYQLAVYPNDRRKYYHCLGGKAYVDECQSGYEFDGNHMSCVPETIPPTTTTTATTTTAATATT